jgi:hypothetical protein
MLTTLHLGPLLLTAATELPTTNGPSSMVRRSSVFRIHGPVRKSWMGTDPGGRLGNFAVRKRNWKQLKLSGGDMRRLTIEAGTRSSPQFFLGGAQGECGRVRIQT